MKFILALAFVIFLSSCASNERQQNASNAIAGIEALGSFDLDEATRQIIAQGATKHSLAAVNTSSVSDLPPPTIDASAIVVDPGQYLKAAEEAYSRATKGFLLSAATWGVAGLALLAAAVRVVGLGGPVVQVASSLILSATQKKEQEKQRSLATLATKAIGVIEELDVKPAKKAVSKVVSPEEQAMILEVLNRKAQQEAKG